MLNEADITYMENAQDEIYELRCRPVTFVYKEETRDPVSGLPIGKTEVEQEVQAVVTEITTRSSEGSRTMENGIIFDEGDIKIDVKIKYVDDFIEEVTEVIYRNKRYELLGNDRKGIGKRNRYEILGREIS